MAENISTLTQAYIDDVYARIQSGNLTPEETALLAAGMQSLQEHSSLTAVILGIAQSSNDNITTSINNLISRLETLESQISASLQSHLPPIVPINGCHEIQALIPNGAYPNYTNSDGFNYCVNYNDEITGRMYVATTQRSVDDIIDFELGYYDADGNYNLLKSGTQFQNYYGGTDFDQAGVFILPLATSPTDDTIKVCIVFYQSNSIWFLTENELNPGSLTQLTANEPRTWLSYCITHKALVFMPDASTAKRLYADGTTELVIDYVVGDSNQFEANFWGNEVFLQLRGDNTPYWQMGTYSNLQPQDMGLRTYTGNLYKYLYTMYSGNGPFVDYNWNIRPYKKLFQIPFTNRNLNGVVEFRKIVFNPDIRLMGTKPNRADATNPVHFQYILNWKGNQNWLLDANNNVLFSVYTTIPYIPYHPHIYRVVYQEPICFDNINKRIVTRTVNAGALLNNHTAHHFITAYQV